MDAPIGLDVSIDGVAGFIMLATTGNWEGGDLSAGAYFYILRDECGNAFKGTITVSY